MLAPDKILDIGGMVLFCGPKVPSGGLGECVRNDEAPPFGVAPRSREGLGSGEGVLLSGGLLGKENSLGNAADDLLDVSLGFET